MHNIFYRSLHSAARDDAQSSFARKMAFICVMFLIWFCGSTAVSAAPRAYDAKPNASSVAKSKSTVKADSLGPNGKTGMWWSRENGWGISLTASADNSLLFAAIYIYDDLGISRWYTASNCRFTGNQCTSRLEETSGSPCAAPFSPSQVTRRDVGEMSLNFASSAFANMSFNINGVTRTVAIERFVFATGAAPPIDYSGLWWNPNESGNGVSITHLADTIFVAWYAFDPSGKPTWYVLTCTTAGTNSCSDTLYSASGPLLASTFDTSRVQLKNIGLATVTFSSSGNARIAYLASGQTITKDFVRFVF